MISILLFIVGLILYNRQRADFAFLRIQAEGAPVRTAGTILMLPIAGSVIVGLVFGFTTGGDVNALLNAIETIAVLELVADISAASAAYIILKRSTSTVSAPAYPSNQLKTSAVSLPTRANFPSVMTTQEAARYLNVPEQRIMDAIYNGELAAAHINSRYNISRRVLDEFREVLKNGSSGV